MKRTWGLVGAGISVLALMGWTIVVWDGRRPPEPDVAPAAAGTPASALTNAPPTVVVELLLLPDGAVRATPGSVRIGLGDVSADNAATAPADREAQQAGPSGYGELATTTRWVSAPAQLLPDGRVKVGPLQLPLVDRYTLQARGEDGLRYYVAAFTPAAPPSAIKPIVGAGMRVHVESPRAHVLLRRVASSAPPAIWQRLQEWTAPTLLEAFNEQPLPVKSGQLLAPFAPGSVEVVLEVGGVEAERKQVSLASGRVLDVRFDPVNQAVARAVSVDLALEFVKQGSGEPVRGLQVSWLSGRTQQTQTTDVLGRVRFDGLDGQQPHQFTLASQPPVGRLPEWPELRPLQLTPEALAKNDELSHLVHHRVELVPLRWLIAHVPPAAKRVQPSKRSPYPIYVLQRQRDGRWIDTAADHFIETSDGLAVSVAEPDTYRIAAALSPWRVLESTPARVIGPDRPTVNFPSWRGTDVTVTVLRDGKALAGAPVQVIGPVGKLPPALLKADSSGRITLTSVTASKVRIEVPGSDQIEVPLSGPQVLADFGTQRSN
jgi:hypothetical protein